MTAPELTKEFIEQLLHYNPETGIFTRKGVWRRGRRISRICERQRREVLRVIWARSLINRAVFIWLKSLQTGPKELGPLRYSRAGSRSIRERKAQNSFLFDIVRALQ